MFQFIANQGSPLGTEVLHPQLGGADAECSEIAAPAISVDLLTPVERVWRGKPEVLAEFAAKYAPGSMGQLEIEAGIGKGEAAALGLRFTPQELSKYGFSLSSEFLERATKYCQRACEPPQDGRIRVASLVHYWMYCHAPLAKGSSKQLTQAVLENDLIDFSGAASDKPALRDAVLSEIRDNLKLLGRFMMQARIRPVAQVTYSSADSESALPPPALESALTTAALGECGLKLCEAFGTMLMAWRKRQGITSEIKRDPLSAKMLYPLEEVFDYFVHCRAYLRVKELAGLALVGPRELLGNQVHAQKFVRNAERQNIGVMDLLAETERHLELTNALLGRSFTAWLLTPLETTVKKHEELQVSEPPKALRSPCISDESFLHAYNDRSQRHFIFSQLEGLGFLVSPHFVGEFRSWHSLFGNYKPSNMDDSHCTSFPIKLLKMYFEDARQALLAQQQDGRRILSSDDLSRDCIHVTASSKSSRVLFSEALAEVSHNLVRAALLLRSIDLLSSAASEPKGPAFLPEAYAKSTLRLGKGFFEGLAAWQKSAGAGETAIDGEANASALPLKLIKAYLEYAGEVLPVVGTAHFVRHYERTRHHLPLLAAEKEQQHYSRKHLSALYSDLADQLSVAEELGELKEYAAPTRGRKALCREGEVKWKARGVSLPKVRITDPRPLDELWEDYFKSRSTVVRDNIFAHSIGMTIKEVRRYASKLPPEVDAHDLLSGALVGLWRAIEDYNPDEHTSFKTYATIRIHGTMIDELRKTDHMSRSTRQIEKELEDVRPYLIGKLNTAPAIDELLLEINERRARRNEIRRNKGMGEVAPLTEERIADAVLDEGLLHNVSLDDPRELDLGHFQFRKRTLHETIADKRMPSPFDLVAGGSIDEVLLRGPRLDRDEERILRGYYEAGLTMKEIGDAISLSESRVSQIHKELIRRYRQYFSSEAGELHVA